MLRGLRLLVRSSRVSAVGSFLQIPALGRPRRARSIGVVVAPPPRRIQPAVFTTSSSSSSSPARSSPSSSPARSSPSSSEPASSENGGGGSGDPSWLRRDLAIVLVHPQIPQNTGNAARTCAATRLPLHLVGPLGFDVADDKKLKRAGLDYWDSVVLRVWPDWASFAAGVVSAEASAASSFPRFVAFSKRGSVHYATPGVYGDASAESPTYLLFGAETTGLPPEALAAIAAVVRLPIEQRLVRSLNLAVSVGIGAYEALRQVDGVKELPEIGE